MSDINNVDKSELESWMNAGISILQEISDLKEGLKDTTKTLSEKYDIPVKILNKSLRVAFKANMHDEQETLSLVEEILVATKRTI